MRIGTQVRTRYQHSETGVIVKPRKSEAPPSTDWVIVRFDTDGRKLCVHRSMLAIANR